MTKLVASARARAAIASVMAGAVMIGGAWFAKAPTGEQYPAAVVMAVEDLILPWEGMRTQAYLDPIKKPTICAGETKGVKLGMTKTVAECKAMLYERAMRDFYKPLTKCAGNFIRAPDPVQASMLSGAYNFGVPTWCHSTAANKLRAGDFRAACTAQTAYNKARMGERLVVLHGLALRREMGDATRIGEAEYCLSGVK